MAGRHKAAKLATCRTLLDQPAPVPAKVIAGIGHDPVAVLAKADSVAIGNLLDAETDEARRLGVFGSPTFAVGEKIFWGDDRLEIALNWWKERK